ncbi:IST1-like protein [Mangifera indica]|uniref:IST1-like protein n=1 Tax=Mangifera indica TaxID=29780 RepID=UPI001CFAF0BE|nr:IST1-like protein [Mangifera indica]
MVPCLLCFAYSTMFDFLRSKFYKKTKSLLKLSKKTLEAAKKKRFAAHKYLKNDLAELLRNGFDLKAYGRVEGLLAEQNMAFCYEYLEQCNSTIYDQLSNMENQRGCPSECREAVATLIDAAARFADLPEARKLRTVFSERYGSFFANFVSKEFVARLSTEPPSQERKIQIMEDVAQEFSIPWDPRFLREQLFKPAPAVQEKPDVPTSNRGNDAPYDRYNMPSSSEDEVVSNHRRRDSGISQDSRQAGSSPSGSSLSEDEVDSRKANQYGLIPPPYVKQNNVKGGGNVEEPMRSNDPPITKSNEARHRKAKSEVPASSARVSSMSPETNDNYESMKKHRRANSLQPGMLPGHVHPKLPDYDDLLARLAPLRGRQSD